MAGLFESVFSGIPAAYGYDKLMERFQGTQDRIGGYDEGLDKYTGGLGRVYDDVNQAGSFQPWSVKSGLGQSSFDPATGQMTNSLSQQQQQYSNQQGQGASEMFGRVMQDPAQRETDIYNRMREMQRPGEERQYSSMNANLFGGGRGGMTSGEFGGSPEQHAFGMAQSEARNAASFGAMGQAQQEMQNYANMGNQMFQNQYMPHQQMQGYAGQGLQNQQMYSQNQQGLAGMLAQLGIGGMTSDVNLSNVRGEASTGLWNALGSAAGGVGGAIDDTGILQKIIDKWF